MSHVIMYVREKPVLKEADRQDNHFADTHTSCDCTVIIGKKSA